MHELDKTGLEAARTAYQSAIPDGPWHADGGEDDAPMQAAISAYLSTDSDDVRATVAECVKEYAEQGFWRSCSGCHELNEGVPTGRYSKSFACHLGGGCSECGGIGAIWDTTDYAAMADHALRDELCSDCPPVGYPTDKTRCTPCPRRSSAPTPAGEPAIKALEWKPRNDGRYASGVRPDSYNADRYVIDRNADGSFHVEEPSFALFRQRFDTLEAAKAAAQADYEARIRSALVGGANG